MRVRSRDGKTWMHVTATFDGSEIWLYLNDLLDASAATPNLLVGANDLPLSIGAEDDGGRSYDGAVDEVRVFNYALDSAAVLAQMQDGLSPDRDGDGFIDVNDAFPDDSKEWLDTDGDGVGDNTDLDDDGDGMPDGWEPANDFDPRLAADADLDADSDDLVNLDEFLLNTNPHGATDPYLVGSWSFDAGSARTAFDDTILANDRLLVGAPVRVPGVSGNALALPGGSSSCPITAAPTLHINKRKVRLQITNTGPSAAMLDALSVAWPSANKKLKKVKLGRDTIYNKKSAGTSVQIG